MLSELTRLKLSLKPPCLSQTHEQHWHLVAWTCTAWAVYCLSHTLYMLKRELCCHFQESTCNSGYFMTKRALYLVTDELERRLRQRWEMNTSLLMKHKLSFISNARPCIHTHTCTQSAVMHCGQISSVLGALGSHLAAIVLLFWHSPPYH